MTGRGERGLMGCQGVQQMARKKARRLSGS